MIKEKETWWDKFILCPRVNWLRWLIYNLPDVPKDTYRNIRYFIQRGKRGYSDCDIWGLNYYLADIITNSVRELKEQVHGVPCDIPKKVGEKHSFNLKKSIKEWKRILGEIQWTFEIVHRINENDWFIVRDERKRSKYKNLEKNSKYHVMTKKECKRYKNGWKLFQKYFFDLWD